MLGLLTSLLPQVINKLFPDKTKAAEVKLKLLELEQTGELKSLETQMSAIVAEAKSKDKWTSRARPSFLYVIYIMILFAIPMGILYAINPQTAHDIITGIKDYLNSIPKILYELFGAGYLGYVGGRSFDKYKKNKNKQ